MPELILHVDASDIRLGSSPAKGDSMGLLEALRGLIQPAPTSSLTAPTYSSLSAHYRACKGTGGMASVFSRLEERIGDRPVDGAFVIVYHELRAWLRDNGARPNTVANYSSVVQRVLRQAWRDHLLPEIPIREWGIEREFRDRVLSETEELQLFNAMAEVRSHLDMGVRLAIRRPIRGRSDLWRLPEESLVLTGKGAPYIRFRPTKTGKRRPRDTYLPLLDKRTGEPFDAVLMEYLIHGRPKGCPLLFPFIHRPEKGHGRYGADAWWEPVGDPDRHWRYLTGMAGILDFKFHDLKHCAMTHMLGVEGWSVEEIQDLGIQYSAKAIEVYWNKNAMRALEKTFARTSELDNRRGVA